MNEAVQTNVSSLGIWVIVVVAVACLAFWLAMLAVVSRDPGPKHRKTSHLQVPVLGGTHFSYCRRSVAPSRESEATFSDSETDAVHGVSMEPTLAPSPVIPAQRAPGTDQMPPVPAPRAADADQPHRATARG